MRGGILVLLIAISFTLGQPAVDGPSSLQLSWTRVRRDDDPTDVKVPEMVPAGDPGAGRSVGSIDSSEMHVQMDGESPKAAFKIRLDKKEYNYKKIVSMLAGKQN